MEEFFEEYVQINDIKQYFLHYPKQSDFVVLFLHGGPGQTEAQLSYKTVLANRVYSVVYYDQRGTGKTQARNRSGQNSITLETLLIDLKETVKYVRDKYPDKPLILLGHSWGSVLGMEYIKSYSDTVDAYVGMGQVVGFKKGEGAAYERCYKLASDRDKRRLAKIKDYPSCITEYNINAKCPKFRKIQSRYNLTGYGGGRSELVKIFLKSPIFCINDIFQMIRAMSVSVNLLKYLSEYDISDRSEFTIPIYFILGENDWQVPSVVTEKYFDSVVAPDKALYRIKNAGHLTDLDNPEEYNRALLSICERLTERYIHNSKGLTFNE